jgi:hypothetical protein
MSIGCVLLASQKVFATQASIRRHVFFLRSAHIMSVS